MDSGSDGAVLPILPLTGYKIANPTIPARIGREELQKLLEGCGWTPLFVEGDDPAQMHPAMAAAIDRSIEKIREIQRDARGRGKTGRPILPMTVLRPPKG